MEGESYYRPREIAVNLGRWKRVKNSLLTISSALVLAGVTACFFVPQSRVSSLRVTARLFGMSGGHGDGLVITKERIIRAMGLKSNDLNMFASVQKAESGLASAWFVSHAYPVEVALTPFSCQVTFHDLFPLSKGMDGAIYLSDGTSYAAASPEVKAAYPEAALDWLVTIPAGQVGENDYGTEIGDLSIELADLDPSLLAGGFLLGATVDPEQEGGIYLYLNLPGVDQRVRMGIESAYLSSFRADTMIAELTQAVISASQAGDLSPVTASWDSWLGEGATLYHLWFRRDDNGRFGIYTSAGR